MGQDVFNKVSFYLMDTVPAIWGAEITVPSQFSNTLYQAFLFVSGGEKFNVESCYSSLQKWLSSRKLMSCIFQVFQLDSDKYKNFIYISLLIYSTTVALRVWGLVHYSA